MKKTVLFLSLLAFVLLGCDSEKTYRVKAGKHYSSYNITKLKKNVINFKFSTDSSWVWDSPDKNGWSKVIGVSYNGNHQNSVRVVYMRLQDTLGVLGYYYYVRGESPQSNPLYKGILDTIDIGKTYYGTLGYENGFYFVRMGDRHHSLHVGNPLPSLYEVFLQKLYIGGTYTINHDWVSTQKYWY